MIILIIWFGRNVVYGCSMLKDLGFVGRGRLVGGGRGGLVGRSGGSLVGGGGSVGRGGLVGLSLGVDGGTLVLK